MAQGPLQARIRMVTTRAPRERHAVRTLEIDCDPVTVLIDRLTIGELDTVAACDTHRGSRAHQDTAPHARIAAIDRYLQPAPDQAFLDDAPTGNLGSLLGARADLVALLYDSLLAAQSPSGEERHDLSVAVRFSAYLAGGPQSDWAKTGTSCAACHALQLCAKRHCDGSAGKAIVWHDAKHVLKTCPVLSFTPETTRILRLFDWTHELTIEGNLPRYHRIALPSGVSLRDEEAWTIAALDVVRQVSDAILIESITKGRHAAE